MMSGQFCLAFGHSYKPFNDVVKKQLTQIIHTNTLTLTEEVGRATAALASIVHPSLTKSILLSTGAEAVECAIRYAKFCTKKDGIVGIQAGYHGLTLATQSISSGGTYATPRIPYSYSIPTPDVHELSPHDTPESVVNRCLEQTRAQLASERGKIAAFVVEPVISVGGMFFPPAAYFQGLKAIAQEHEALFIFDECQTGLGRTGTWFGYEHTGVIPDILVVAKIAGNGLPVSTVTMSREIAGLIEEKFIHFSSHQNDALSAAVLEFVIEHMKQQNTLAGINEQGEYLLTRLDHLSRQEPWIERPRGLGLMIGFDLPAQLFTRGNNPGQDLILHMEERGVFIQAIRRGRTFRILPSYLINRREIDKFISVLDKSFRALRRKYA